MHDTTGVLFDTRTERPFPSRLALDWSQLSLVTTASNECIEVVVAWGETVLSLRHSAPRETLCIGSSSNANFALPEGTLGEDIRIAPDDVGALRVFLPRGSRGVYRLEEGTELELGELANVGEAGIPVASGAMIRSFVGDFVLTIRALPREKAFPRAPLGGFDRSVLGYFGTSASIFGGLFAAFAFFVPPLGLSDEVAIEKERLLDLSHYMKALAEREREREKNAAETSEPRAESGGNTAAGPGAAGAAGTTRPRLSPGRAALAGEKSEEHRPSRASLLEDVKNSALIGLLSGAAAGLDIPIFERDRSSGPDDTSARGNLFGSDIGEVVGSGLTLAGLDEGGGYRGSWVGASNNLFGNTLGAGCQGSNCKGGIGRGNGTGHLEHKTKIHISMPATTDVVGSLPAEVIRRTVRQNFGRFRFCYEKGLTKNPSLEGRVSMRFVIGRDGSISNVGVGQTDLGDSEVNSCLVQAFYGLTFPAPEKGIVRVTYPIIFSPQ